MSTKHWKRLRSRTFASAKYAVGISNKLGKVSLFCHRHFRFSRDYLLTSCSSEGFFYRNTIALHNENHRNFANVTARRFVVQLHVKHHIKNNWLLTQFILASCYAATKSTRLKIANLCEQISQYSN